VEIVSSATKMATDFSHGWSSMDTGRLFRIEINIGMGYDPEYIFSIDGVKFDDLPSKPLGASVGKLVHDNTNSGRYGTVIAVEPATQHSATPVVPRRTSVKPSPDSGIGSRGTLQSPAQRSTTSQSTQEFDPFEASPEPFDPFSSFPAGGNTHQASVKATPPVRRPPSKPSSTASLFGTMEESTHSHASSNRSSFDAFDSSDAFPSTSAAATAALNNTSGFDLFESNLTTTTNNTNAVTNNTKSNNINTDINPFDMPITSAPAANKSTRRSSAAEISLDFAGLSFVAAPEPPKMAAVPRDVPAAVPQPVKTEEVELDPWASNLVDLDLSNRTAQRRSSLQNSGPSLNNLMGQPNQPVTNRRPSWTAQEMLNSLDDPFGAPPILTASAMPTAPAPAPVNSFEASRRMSSAQMISSLGQAPPPPPYFAPAPGPVMSSMTAGGGSGRNSMIMQQPPVGMNVSMNNIPTNGRASFVSIPPIQRQTPTQPKSSLDSLDWKA